MICFEDMELEEAFLAGELPVAPMISVTLGGDGACVTALRCAEQIAREYVDKYSSTPLSCEALTFLLEKGEKFFSDHGYDFFPEDTDVILDLAWEGHKDTDVPGDGAILRLLSGAEVLRYVSTLDAELDEELCAAVIVDDRIVCAAGVCDLCDSDETEVYVECNEAFRRRGYGKCALTVLCSYLVSKGEKPVYRTYRSNEASVALARSAGFVLRSQSLSIVGYSPKDFEESDF